MNDQFDAQTFDVARFLVELVQALEADFKDLHRYTYDSMAQQNESIRRVHEVAGRMEHTERLMAQYAPIWDSLHEEVVLFTATRGQQLENHKREIERLQEALNHVETSSLARVEKEESRRAKWRKEVEASVDARLEALRREAVEVQTAKIGRSERVLIAFMTLLSGLIGALVSKVFTP